MIEIKGKYASAKIFTDDVEEEAVSQIKELLNQPFAKDSHPRFMPDVHAGKGCTIGTTMTITACATSSTNYNWEFAPDVILFHSTSGTEYGVLRADHYGWGAAIGDACANITAKSDWDWDAFQTYIPDSTVSISIYNFGDGIAEVHYDFTKTVDETTTTHYQYYSEIPVTVDELYANLVFENCDATFE